MRIAEALGRCGEEGDAAIVVLVARVVVVGDASVGGVADRGA